MSAGIMNTGIINTATAYSGGVTVTASAAGIPIAVHLDNAELRFGAEALTIRILEITARATRLAQQELR